MKISSLRLLPCIVLFVCASALCVAQTYTTTDLGTIAGMDYSVARGVNGTGMVTGASGLFGPGSNVFSYSNGSMTNLGTLGGPSGIGNGINASGQVAGYSQNGSSAYRAFLSNGNSLQDIGDLGGGSAVGYALNDSGQVVGSAVTATHANHPFLYSNGQMTDLGTLGSPDNVDWWNSAQGINNSGVVTGTSYDSQGNFFGFVWQNGKMTKIGTLGGPWSQGYAINNVGQVTGIAYTKNRSAHAFLMSPAGKLKDLGAFGKFGTSWGFGINDAGVVVGQATFQNTYHAFVYSGTRIQDLNKLVANRNGWVFIDARGINNAGQIAVTGMRSDGTEHAFLLTPH